MRNRNNQSEQSPKQPTHDVKLRKVQGEKATYERIGAGWQRDDGAIYVRLIGAQLVTEGFSIYPIED